jgi:hypothetical protein
MRSSEWSVSTGAVQRAIRRSMIPDALLRKVKK